MCRKPFIAEVAGVSGSTARRHVSRLSPSALDLPSSFASVVFGLGLQRFEDGGLQVLANLEDGAAVGHRRSNDAHLEARLTVEQDLFYSPSTGQHEHLSMREYGSRNTPVTTAIACQP